MPEITMKKLLESGVHFGHQTNRWNPIMKKYIYGARNGIYIVDLQKTLKKFREAEECITKLAEDGKKNPLCSDKTTSSRIDRKSS